MSNRGFVFLIPILAAIIIALLMYWAISDNDSETLEIEEEEPPEVTYEVIEGTNELYVKIHVDGEFEEEIHYGDWFWDKTDNKRKYFYEVDANTGEPIFLTEIEDVEQIERYENPKLPSITDIMELPNMIRTYIDNLTWNLRRINNA